MTPDSMAAYHASTAEVVRTNDLLRLVPKGLTSVLDVGARDGHFTKLFAQTFSEVTALDLQKPAFNLPGVKTVAGDVTKLEFADNSFDLVFCAEVLEHVPGVEEACRPLLRVSRQYVLIGVPFEQDLRNGQATCLNCGKTSPAYGHVNSFSEKRLSHLFHPAEIVERSLLGKTEYVSNFAAAFLQNVARNPWGVYDAEEGCAHCGAKLTQPGPQPLWRRTAGVIGLQLQLLQAKFMPRNANWIHILFRKPR